MIRRSTAIATAAILLSLLVHFLGLSFTQRVQPERPEEDATNDVVALGNAFEDVAENLSEPVVPEYTPAPEPQTETIPEPEHTDTPTSEALVASPDPQRTASPDAGSAQVVQPDTTGQSEPEQGRIPEPETVEPSGKQETIADVAVTPPVEVEKVAQAPKGNPDAGVETVEAVIAAPVRNPPATPVPVPSTVPVIPLERETIAPETSEVTVESTPEDPETVKAEDETGGSDLAVVASPRPRVSAPRPSAESLGLSDGSTEFSELLFPPLIESPLTAYLRDRTDLVVRQNAGTQSGGPGFLDSRGPGNSDVTNYAGQVLVHLNRAPLVHVSARGSARVFFEINADGTLALVDIIDGTGSQEIYNAAKAQVRSASPFPRPPNGASYRLTFVYWSD